MTCEFRATTPADESELAAFLARVFCVSPQSRFLDPAFMRWKYFVPREDYPCPRSYVLERSGKIVAHAGIWPVELREKTEVARGAQLMDFAADPNIPGSGAMLVRLLRDKLDFIYGIGGTEKARRALPRMGFQQVQEAWLAARPLRPVRQMLSGISLDWKSPARFARNILWSALPLRANAGQWRLAPADLEQRRISFTPSGRIPRANAFFRYLQGCPSSRVTVHDVFVDGMAAGRIALSAPYEQTRVLGIWVDEHHAAALPAMYKLAQLAAASAVEITVLGSTAAGREAAEKAGFRIRRILPVYLLRNRGSLPSLPLEFQMADSNDQGFLVDDPPEFMT